MKKQQQRGLRRKVRVLVAQRERLLRELMVARSLCRQLQARWRGSPKEPREASSP